jgi:hypothetical protein
MWVLCFGNLLLLPNPQPHLAKNTCLPLMSSLSQIWTVTYRLSPQGPTYKSGRKYLEKLPTRTTSRHRVRATWHKKVAQISPGTVRGIGAGALTHLQKFQSRSSCSRPAACKDVTQPKELMRKVCDVLRPKMERIFHLRLG